MPGPYVMGVDFGTGGCRVGIFDAEGNPKIFHGVEFPTRFPRSGWAEQDADDWWDAFVSAARYAVQASDISPEDIVGLSTDATASTVLAIGEDDTPLRPALMWMDVRAADQAARMAATGDQALRYCGFGDVSAEWGLPKSLWLKEKERETYAKTKLIVDCNDWFTHRLTGEWASSVNILAAKFFYDGRAGGHATSLLESVGFSDFLDHVPDRVLMLGEVVGGLTPDVARTIGLKPGTPVAMGSIDAYSGALGLGVVEPGTMALITGSSHVMIGQAAEPIHGTGFWGAYTDAMIPGQFTVEAGQVSTGSVVKWLKDNFASSEALMGEREHRDPYHILTEGARQIPIGSDGLVFLDYFQGNRSPHTDPHVRGAIWGLGLGHKAPHVFRALLEGICFGTESIFRAMREQGFETQRICVSGGPTKSKLWMQMHADVSGVPITLTKVSEGPVLGSALLAAVGAGLYPDIQTAAKRMVQVKDTIEPNQEAHEEYQFYFDLYNKTYPALKELMHTMTRHENQR